MNHNVDTRFAKNNKYPMQWPHKTGTRKQYKFIGTKILNLIPIHLHALTLHRFKIDFKNGFYMNSTLTYYYNLPFLIVC